VLSGVCWLRAAGLLLSHLEPITQTQKSRAEVLADLQIYRESGLAAVDRTEDTLLERDQRAKAEAFDRGLLIYPSGGTVDGRSGDHILLAPPYNATDEELDVIVDLLGETLDAIL